ncbi:MAG TPA: ribonuclease J [Rhizobiales bacterium]|nr:ribonuclease J [Hyphomicrobiales bacterium]
MPKKPQDQLVYVPLGGAGEIGMNMYLYGLGKGKRRKWIMVDCGVKFGDERDPGIDVIVPDTGFIEQYKKDLLAIIITHGHEDHLGAVAWLWPKLQAPVYCTPFAAELLGNKLSEKNLLDETPLRVHPLGSRFEVGPFDIELVAVTHSIPEPASVVIRTSAGTIVHSGDWKLDRTPAIPPHMDENRFREIGREGVDVLVCDSTNVLRAGHSPSEADVAKGLEKIIRSAKKRVAVTTFASHVGRLTSIVKAARAVGRDVVLAGRAMHTVSAAAKEIGLLKEAGYLLDQDAYDDLPRSKCLLVCTGSQGEARAAMARIASGNHPFIRFDRGDMAIFSSKTIPGNEKSVAAVFNDLAEQGVEIITSDEEMIHTSGHPRQGELLEYYDWLKPKALIPMHGEMRHLDFHTGFAKKAGIDHTLRVSNGELTQLLPGPAKIIEDIDSGRIHIDGRLFVEADRGPARMRRKLAFSGVIAISVTLSDRGALLSDPQIILDGIPEQDEEGYLIEESLLDDIEDTIEQVPRKAARNDDVFIENIKRTARRTCSELWGKRPIVHVMVHRV